MVGAHQNLNGSRNLTTPLSVMVCHPWASTCYDQAILPLNLNSLSTHYADMKADTKYRKRRLGVTQDHCKLEITPFDSIAHTSSYRCSIVAMSLSCTVFQIGPIARYWSKIANPNLLHLYLAPPLGVTPLEFRRDLWPQKTRVFLSYGVVWVILQLAILTHTGVWQSDGRTDRQTRCAYTTLA